ncbi:glycosyltransferase [Methylobacterium sp. CM6246]
MKTLYGLYSSWAASAGARASRNPLIRLATGRSLPAASDITSAAEQIATLEPYVDTGFYASWYGITVDPVRDYLVLGWREGRDPRPDFSTADYLAARPYLAAAGINPFLHWVTAQRARGGPLSRPDTGQAERLARRLVDGAFYLANNPDLQAAGVDPAGHYMASGWREGREPSPHFDTLAYCLTRGISYATQNPLVHYVLHGGPTRPEPEDLFALQAETLAPYFDAAYYRDGLDEREAQELAEASDAELLRTYVSGGWRKMRSPRQDFDPAGFVQARAGSRAVIGDPFFRYVAETRLAGEKPFAGEDLPQFPVIDEVWYRTTYPDAQGLAPYVHFSRAGWRELRDPGPNWSTLGRLLQVCGSSPARPPIEETGWLGAIGYVPLDRAAFLDLQAELAALHFDHAFYRQRYGLAEDVDAVRDYCDTGWRRGRNPRAAFNGWAYRAHRPYVEATGIAPFVHHLATALLRGIDLSGDAFDPGYGTPPAAEDAELIEQAELIEPFFDAAWYLKRYPDTRGFENGPAIHFLSHGQEEDRDPSKAFSTRFYRRAYGHLFAPGEAPFLHYVRTGRAAGLMGCPEDLGSWPAMEAPESHDWDGLPSALTLAQARVVVIMPVYKGRGETLRAIHACLSAPQKTPFTLLAVNDRSPDPQLTADLKDLAGRGLFHLVENPDNLGFVRSVNRGLSLRQGRAVVLLNSDAQVFGDWLDRLVAHAEAAETEGRPPVGSVTPLASNATICSYPKFNANNAMALEIPRPELDQAAKALNRGRSVEVPTGVGFCLYMTAAALDAVGTLDAVAFGKGYGEENDWCMRARKAGFSNLLAEDVYVYHAGQISFGLDPGGEYDQGQAALLAKHPDYPALVGQFVQADPGRRGRARLDLYRLARHFRGRAVLFVTHSWGGGIQRHIDDMIARLKEEGTAVVLLSVDRARNIQVNVSYRSREFVYLPNLDSLYLPRDAEAVAAFVEQLAPVLIHVHSLAGLRWNAARALMDLVSGSGRPYAWTLHDFSPVCHRNHLVMPDGRYCGLAPVPVCRDCLASDADGYEEPDPEERRAVFGRFLARAARVFAPSADTAGRIGAVYPELAITVRPHVEHDTRARPTALRRPSRVRQVAVLGGVSMPEGGLLLQALAADARRRDLPLRFAIVGFSDPALTDGLERAGITETGRYSTDDPTLDRVARAAVAIAETGHPWEDDEMLDLLPKVSADLILVPSIWPETHSTAPTLGLRTGLPVVAFDLGAQGERLRTQPHGHLLPFDLAEDPAACNDQLLTLELSDYDRRSVPPEAAAYENLMRDYYALMT